MLALAAGVAAAVLLSALIIAWLDAVDIICRQAPISRAALTLRVLGGAAVFLLGLAGAGAGVVALAMALEVVP